MIFILNLKKKNFLGSSIFFGGDEMENDFTKYLQKSKPSKSNSSISCSSGSSSDSSCNELTITKVS